MGSAEIPALTRASIPQPGRAASGAGWRGKGRREGGEKRETRSLHTHGRADRYSKDSVASNPPTEPGA